MTVIAQELYAGLDAILAARTADVGHQQVAAWDADLWETLDRQGFATIDPSDPDIGLSEFLALARAVGARAVGLPLVEAGLATWMAQTVSLKLPDGVVLPALDPEPTLRAEQVGGELVVSGRMVRVPWGRHAEHVVAFADTPEGPCLVAVAPTGVVEGANLAGEPRDDVLVDAQRVLAPHVAPAGDLRPLEVLLRAAVLRASQAAGAMETVLDLTVDYAGQREQFGAPIASFQAVQQHLVTVTSGAAATRAGVEAAAGAAPSHRRMAAASAKVVAGLHATGVARAAHQVFGAIGVTEEHRLHLLTRRLWSWQDECGRTADWSRYLTERLVFPGGPGLWPVLTPPCEALDARDVHEVVPW